MLVSLTINMLRLRQNFADNIFKVIFFNEKFGILIQILLKFIPKAPINASTGSDNGLAPIRWRAIIWINDGLVQWH